MKTAIKHENDEFLVISLKHISGLTVDRDRPGTPKSWAIAHENGHKTWKRRVFIITLKHVSGVTVVVNSPGTQKLWAISHENGHKTRNRPLFGISLKHVSRLTGHKILLGTTKLCAIAHKNGHKTWKRQVFRHNSQTCIVSYGRCKLPSNPKTVGNSSWKWP